MPRHRGKGEARPYSTSSSAGNGSWPAPAKPRSLTKPAVMRDPGRLSAGGRSQQVSGDRGRYWCRSQHG